MLGVGEGSQGSRYGGEQMGKTKENQTEGLAWSIHTDHLMGKRHARPGGRRMRQGEYSEGQDAVLPCLDMRLDKIKTYKMCRNLILLNNLGFKSEFCHFLGMLPWIKPSISLNLSFS